MEEINDGKGEAAKKYPGAIYRRHLTDAVKSFLKRTGKAVRYRRMSSEQSKRKREWWSDCDPGQRKQVIATSATVDGKEGESKSEPTQLENPTEEILPPQTLTAERKYERIHAQTEAFAVAVPENMTSVMKRFLYSEGGLMDLIDKRRCQIDKLLENGSNDPLDQPVDASPLMCQGRCTFVINPFFLDPNNGEKKTLADMVSLLVSPKGLKDSQWMLGLLQHLQLDLFLENISAAVNHLNGTDDFKATVLSQSILCTPYNFQRQKKVIEEHIDGIPQTTRMNNMYTISVPLTLLEGSPPELHIISDECVFKYKFQMNHAVGLSATQGHATASLTNSSWWYPNNVRVNLLFAIADQNYLSAKPENYREQILHMSDPCYPGSKLPMEKMVRPTGRCSQKVALWREQWSTYVNQYMKHSEQAREYFRRCVEGTQTMNI